MITIDEFVTKNKDDVLSLLKELVLIPAPSNYEHQKAIFCKNWLTKHGANNTYIDEAENVICKINCEDDSKEKIIFTAHTDTVFPLSQKLLLKEEANKLLCPGIGDDTANLAIMFYCVLFMLQNDVKSDYGFIFAATSGEEGLGNLRGSRKLFENFGKDVKEAIAFDLYLDSLICESIGSERYSITVKTAGGHSFFDCGEPNAIEQIAQIVNDLYNIKIPDYPKTHTTQNVGMISGGTSVNTIASQANILYEYRSNNPYCLEIMKDFFDMIIAKHSIDNDIIVEVMGSRPCGKDVDINCQNALLERVLNSYVDVMSLPKLKSGSTDCNIPLSMGIPAICCGLILGAGAHKIDEYIFPDSIPNGMKIALNIITSYLLK